MSKDLPDANIFIQAKNLHYGFDFCPAFWEWLDTMNTEGKVASIERVKDELHTIEDELSEWANGKDKGFFLPADEYVIPRLSEVSNWASQQTYEAAAIAGFLQVADYYLVAHAKAYGCIIVTHEVPSDSIRKIKIPNACIGLGITCVTPYEMLRRERAKFVLSK